MEQDQFSLEMSKEELLAGIHKLRSRIAEVESIMQALYDREENLRYLLDESSDPIFAFYPDGTYRYVNRAFAEGVGREVKEIIGHKIWDVFPKEEADKRYAALKWVFDHGVQKVIEVNVPRPDGDLYFITTIKPIKNERDEVIAVICSSKDITERKRMEEELRRISTHDELTGVHNRHYFEMELERMQDVRHYPVSIVVADVDGLKAVNDLEGHDCGDTLLRQAARTLERAFRFDDVVARTGGDEFAVILPATTEPDASVVVNRLREYIEKNEQFRMSIGVATEREGLTLWEVMRQADERMYEEKRRRKSANPPVQIEKE